MRGERAELAGEADAVEEIPEARVAANRIVLGIDFQAGNSIRPFNERSLQGSESLILLIEGEASENLVRNPRGIVAMLNVCPFELSD